MKRIFSLLLFMYCTYAYGQYNVFPGTGNAGIGTTSPITLLHIRSTSATNPEYPSDSTRGNVLEFLESNNDAMEFGVAKGQNTRRAWILARHSTVSGFGEWYATLHLQPQVNNISQYRGVAIGYTASTNLPLQVGLAVNGNVGIGTINPQANLAVNGNILAKEIKVQTNITVPDYVFNADYKLPSLVEIEAYAKEHKHLPEIPSAKEINEHGLDVAKMNLLLLKKVEELTLQLIEKDKEIQYLRTEQQKLGQQFKKIETLLNQHKLK